MGEQSRCLLFQLLDGQEAGRGLRSIRNAILHSCGQQFRIGDSGSRGRLRIEIRRGLRRRRRAADRSSSTHWARQCGVLDEAAVLQL